MKPLAKRTTPESIAQFVEHLHRGFDSIIAAGTLAAQCVDEDRDWVNKVCESHPDLTAEFVRRVEMVGRKRMMPELVLSETPGARRLRRLPYELQARYLKEPVPVLVQGGNGWEMLNVDLRNLSPFQAAQAFNGDHVRGDAEQRAYLEDVRLREAAPPASVVPYRIHRGELVVERPCSFSRKEIARILVELQ